MLLQDSVALNSRSSTVSMESVHRTTPSEVIPTGWRRLSDQRFLVSGSWNHPYYTPAHGFRFDPLLIVESMRQSTILISHEAYGVPNDHRFILQSLSFSTQDGRPNPEFGIPEAPESSEVDLEVAFFDLKERGGVLASMRSEVIARRDGVQVAAGGGLICISSPRLYRRLRGDRVHVTAGMPASGAGAALPVRTRADDVVVVPAAEPGVWKLLVDTTHPTFFQRPNDHVPGMLLLEAARQLSRVVSAPGPFVPRAGSIVFGRYAELSSPVWLRARMLPERPGGGHPVAVTGEQDGNVVFEAVLDAS
ncbi:MAG: 2-oxo-3-(phosphooxy)propyl 3-oxoalkanoate synthase [Streptomyces sp.]|nr:2-oxo-3-(phosphooxy)propyl 3-oxoalkanoate synthase [Streptomyces sp.]